MPYCETYIEIKQGAFVKSGEPEISEERKELEPGKPGKLGEPVNSMKPGEPGETEPRELYELREPEENMIPRKHINESIPLKSKEIDHPLIQFTA